jgi:hypothetical protein
VLRFGCGEQLAIEGFRFVIPFGGCVKAGEKFNGRQRELMRGPELRFADLQCLFDVDAVALLPLVPLVPIIILPPQGPSADRQPPSFG